MDSSGESMEMSLCRLPKMWKFTMVADKKQQMVDQLHQSPGTHPMGDLTPTSGIGFECRAGSRCLFLRVHEIPMVFFAEEFKTSVTSL